MTWIDSSNVLSALMRDYNLKVIYMFIYILLTICVFMHFDVNAGLAAV